MLTADLTDDQLAWFVILERTTSGLSLCGSLFIALTFLFSEHFHKQINRMIFYASMGNVFSNIATTISRAGIEAAGSNGNFDHPICQLQGFLIQMFLPADILWTFCMALNVYLTFFYRFGKCDIRRLEKWYILLCYGVPFVPALVLLFVEIDGRGRFYTSAALWCWIGPKYDTYRISLFYGPIWLVILATMIIYAIAGRKIYLMTRELQNLQKEFHPPITIPGQPFNGEPNEIITVLITSQTTVTDSRDDSPTTERGPGSTFSNTVAANAEKFIGHSWAISADRTSEDLEIQQHRKGCNSHTDGSCFSSGTSYTPRPSNAATIPIPTFRKSVARNANSRMLQYARVSTLFFLAMMITWIPSSANRLYTLVHHEQIQVSLLYISALVLPLQGLWNALIYTVCSLDACRAMWRQIRGNRFLSGGIGRTITHAFADNNEDGVETRELSNPSRKSHHFVLKPCEHRRQFPRDPDSESIAVLKEERFASLESRTTPDVTKRNNSNLSIQSCPGDL